MSPPSTVRFDRVVLAIVSGHGGGVLGYWTRVIHAPDTGKTAFWVATNDTAIFDPPIEELAPYLNST